MKKIILITETYRGIGKVLALHFLSQDATIIDSSRKVQSELAYYPNFFNLKLDLNIRIKKGLKIASIHSGWVKTSFAPSNVYGQLTTTETAKENDFIISPFSSSVFLGH